MKPNADFRAMLELRAARPEDEPAVLALLREAELVPEFGDGFRVAALDGRIVACARLDGLELARVAVSKDHRRKGFGAALVRNVLSRASQDVFVLAVAPDFFSTRGFERLAEAPLALRDKASRECASSVPMVWKRGI